jgi:hypothetical protein
MLEDDNSLKTIVLVLKDHLAFDVKHSITPEHTAKLVSRILVCDSLTILELDVVGSFISHDEVIATDLSSELIETPHLIQPISVFY